MSRRKSEGKKVDENKIENVCDYLDGIADVNVPNKDKTEKGKSFSWDEYLELPPLPPYPKLIDLDWCNAYLSRGEDTPKPVTDKAKTNPHDIDNDYIMKLANFTSDRTVANGTSFQLLT